MNKLTGTQASAQAEIEDFNGIFQERLRGIVRAGLLAMFEQEVTDLCGPAYRSSASKYRRGGTEMVNLDTTEGREWLSKSRVRVMKEDGKESEARLKAYAAAKQRKGMFDGETTYALLRKQGERNTLIATLLAWRIHEGWLKA